MIRGIWNKFVSSENDPGATGTSSGKTSDILGDFAESLDPLDEQETRQEFSESDHAVNVPSALAPDPTTEFDENVGAPVHNFFDELDWEDSQ